MAGAPVPAAGAIGLDTVTNAAQETNLENLAEAARRMAGIGVVTLSNSVISAGVIAPNLGLVLVDTEGAAATDNLDNIDPGAYLEGSFVLLISASAGSRVVTCRNAQGGSGQLLLANSSNFALSNTFSWIVLRQVGGVWVEIQRNYGSDLAGYRSFIGLGSVATLNNGAVNAATLQGNAASAFLLAAGTAANSTLFAGLAASAFLRADLASLQTLAGSLRAASGRLEAAITSAAGTSILSLLAGGNERTQLFFDGTVGHATLRLLDALAAVQAGIRLRPGLVPDYWNGSSWVPFFVLPTPSPWLARIRWDKLDGNTAYAPEAHYLIHSATGPAKPGSGATRFYRILAGITGRRGSGDSPRFAAQIYVGNAGNDTDTLIYESAEVQATSTTADVTAVVDEEFEVPAGTYVTLILEKKDSRQLIVQQSAASTYKIDTMRTYLRVDQVG